MDSLVTPASAPWHISSLHVAPKLPVCKAIARFLRAGQGEKELMGANKWKLPLFLLPLDMLGARLESEGEGLLSSEACLCYISSGNVERLAKCWVKNHETTSPLALQVQML